MRGLLQKLAAGGEIAAKVAQINAQQLPALARAVLVSRPLVLALADEIGQCQVQVADCSIRPAGVVSWVFLYRDEPLLRIEVAVGLVGGGDAAQVRIGRGDEDAATWPDPSSREQAEAALRRMMDRRDAELDAPAEGTVEGSTASN